MRVAPIKIYVALVALTSALGLSALASAQPLVLPADVIVGVLVLIAIGVLSESLAITVQVGGASGTSSITFIPLLTSVVLFGPMTTIVLVVVSGLTGEFLIRKKEPIRAVFNLSQWVLGVVVGGWLYTSLGGVSLAVTTAEASLAAQIGPFVVFGVAFLGVNHIATALAIAISQGLSFDRVFSSVIGRSGSNILNDILVSPIAFAVAFFYLELGIAGFFVSLLPLLFIRYSYLNNARLLRANRDLLKALVKAIETRDPYTSGHSMRVAMLAKRIARELGLNASRVAEIETAALLHDIGKIEQVYDGILKKPGALSAEERAIIESHVTKGVELLRSLSSFPSGIIAAVRHHHEREDGKGYPDGLTSEAIPLGAKIIMTCDAIDAMLSDRPYRNALTLSEVRNQLLTHTGTQFDERLVSVVVDSNVLDEHQAAVGESIGIARADYLSPDIVGVTRPSSVERPATAGA